MVVNRHSDSIAIITLGESVLGGSEAVEMTTYVHSFVEHGGKLVIVDAQRVGLMNSSGLGMLVAAHSTMHKFGGKVILVNIPEKIESLLSMTRLDTVLKTFPTIAEALANTAGM